MNKAHQFKEHRGLLFIPYCAIVQIVPRSCKDN